MQSPVSGSLLIAEPFLKDPNFMRTVVLLCEHQEEGSVGFVINKHFNYSLNELVPELGDMLLPVYYGGPVQMDRLHFIHAKPNIIPGANKISEGIYWGGDFEIAKKMLTNGELLPSDIRFFMGYSGWGNHQLADELKSKSWLVSQSTHEIVFQLEAEEIWAASLKKLGAKYAMMVNFPTDPQLN